MGLTAKLEGFLPDVTQVLRRFPVAVLAAVILCAYQLYKGNFDLFDGSDVRNTLMAAFFAGGAAHLFAEGRKLGSVANVAIAALAALFAGSLFQFSNWFHTAPLFFFGGIILALMISPFLHGSGKQGAVWLFNLRLALAFGLAIVVGVVFGLGLSAIVAGLKFLLNIDFGHDAFENIWTVAVLLVGPVYGLTLVPEKLDEEVDLSAHKGSLLERGVSILVNYVMVPLGLVYAAILHAYAAKIAVLASLPKGEIGLIVSLFAVGGTVTWLIGWPWREQGTLLLGWFMRGWFWLLPIPACLLSVAIWRRVADYGVTPDRYGIALVAVWTAFVFGYLVWRRNRADMRMVLGAAAVLLLVGSFGPLGAFSTTAESQFTRLTKLLEQGGAIKDGKFVGQLLERTGKRSEGYSMVQVLGDVGALDRVKAWFGPTEKFTDYDGRYGRYGLVSDITNKLGLVYDPGTADQVGWNAYQPSSFDVASAAQILGPFQASESTLRTEPLPGGVVIKFDDSQFELTVAGNVSRIPTRTLMEKLLAETGKADRSKQIPVRVELDDRVSLLVVTAYGQAGEKPHLGSIGFWIVQRK